MNEQNITRRKEVDLEITDFLWEIVRNWRVIAICLIIGAVLLCGYQYIKDSRNADTTADEVVEEYSKTVHEMKEALGAQDLDQVYGAVAIKKQLDEKSDYADNSPLMAVNPYAENLILLQYRVQSDEGNAAELAAIYQDYLMYGELASEMIDCDSRKDETIYAKETYETGFTVRIRGSREADCKELAENVKKGLSAYAQRMDENFTAHELELVNESSNIIVDQELAQLQDDTALAIKNLGEHLDTIKSKMNGNQLELYVELTENQPEQNEDSAEQTGNEEETNGSDVPEQISVHISVSKFIIGGIIGIALAIIFILLKYLLSGNLRSEAEIKALYHNDVLGTIRSSVDGKRGKIDKWYVGARYGKSGKMSLEQEVELICANMKIACKENQKVYLTGSDLSGTSTEILEKIRAECEKRGVTVVSGREICYYAEALEELAKIGQVVFIEEMRKSRYNNMYQEVIRCREHQIPILGMIVIGA